MATSNFFNNDIEVKTFFDEGPRVVRRQSSTVSNSGSIDTSGIDAYRQGVELTQQKFFDAGLAKIHAGEPGHRYRNSSYGMGINFGGETVFQDIDYFNPVTFLRSQVDGDGAPLVSNIITFPIITDDIDHIENYRFDGVIEPLTIRSKASFFSIEVPFEAHDTRGHFMAGNINQHGGADPIVSQYVYDTNYSIPPFYDQYAEDVPFVMTGSVARKVGLYSFDSSVQSPFVDRRYVQSTLTTGSYDSQMLSALSRLSGSIDDHLILNGRSSPCGWSYENNIIYGTDSIAFGGMGH